MCVLIEFFKCKYLQRDNASIKIKCTYDLHSPPTHFALTLEHFGFANILSIKHVHKCFHIKFVINAVVRQFYVFVYGAACT